MAFGSNFGAFAQGLAQGRGIIRDAERIKAARAEPAASATQPTAQQPVTMAGSTNPAASADTSRTIGDFSQWGTGSVPAQPTQASSAAPTPGGAVTIGQDIKAVGDGIAKAGGNIWGAISSIFKQV